MKGVAENFSIKGMPIFLTFDPKHRLWVLVRIASPKIFSGTGFDENWYVALGIPYMVKNLKFFFSGTGGPISMKHASIGDSGPS